jgi:hypothetical protein
LMFGCCLYVVAVIGGAGAGCLRPNSGAYGYALQAALWRVGLPAVPDRRYARRRGVHSRPRWHAGTEGKYRQRQRFPMPFGTPLGAQPVVAREPGRRRPKRRSPPGTRIGPELCVGGTRVMLWGTDIRVRPGACVLRSGAPASDSVACCRPGVVLRAGVDPRGQGLQFSQLGLQNADEYPCLGKVGAVRLRCRPAPCRGSCCSIAAG